MTIERQIREAQLAQVMHTLDRHMMTNTMKKYKGRFELKYRAFKIWRNKIEAVVTQSTFMWKDIYGLSIKAKEKKENEEIKEPKKSEKEKDEIIVIEVDVEGTKETTKETTTKDE